MLLLLEVSSGEDTSPHAPVRRSQTRSDTRAVGAVVMVVGRVLQFVGCAVLDGDLDAALPLVGVPDAVVEAELYFLLDIAGEVVGHDPARVDVERRLASVGIGIDDLELDGIPR